MIVLPLLLQVQLPVSDEKPETKATQARVDKLVRGCSAASVVQLRAMSKDQVAIQFIDYTKLPPPPEVKKFDCVLSGMKKMPDLQFGLIGNEADPKPEKK